MITQVTFARPQSLGSIKKVPSVKASDGWKIECGGPSVYIRHHKWPRKAYEIPITSVDMIHHALTHDENGRIRDEPKPAEAPPRRANKSKRRPR